MTTQKRVHFLVCVKEEELIETIRQMCTEHDITPDFIYRRYVTCGKAPMPIASRDLKALLKVPEELNYISYTEQSQEGVNLFQDVMYKSQDPIVSCVRVHTNWTHLFRLLFIPEMFTRKLVLYHPEEKKRTNQKTLFSSLFTHINQKTLLFADTPEEIFTHLGVLEPVA